MVGKAGHLAKGANPRFVVTSLVGDAVKAVKAGSRPGGSTTSLTVPGVRRESRITECQFDLIAERTSAATMRANPLRLRFALLAHVLIDSLRRIALAGTQLADTTAGSLRLKLLKIGARVTVSVRRIKIAMTSARPWRRAFCIAHERLSIAAC